MIRLFFCRFPIWFLLLLVGCATTISIPEAEESEFFRNVEGGFHIHVREGTIRYTLQLEQKIPFPHPFFLTVRYENPADKKNPHVEHLVWEPKMETLTLSSPPLEQLREKVFYEIEIDIFDDARRAEKRDSHQVFIYSTIDTRSYGR